MIESQPESEGASQFRGNHYFYPPPSSAIGPLNLTGVDELTQGFRRAYTSVFKAAQAQDWNAVAVHCRRSLEALMKLNIPEEDLKGNLIQNFHKNSLLWVGKYALLIKKRVTLMQIHSLYIASYFYLIALFVAQAS